jgi:hypothetical protein
MNPETQSTRAKITQTSVNGLVQAIVDSLRGSHDWLNSGDVGLHKTASAAAGSVIDLPRLCGSAADRSPSAVRPRGGLSAGRRAA